MIDFDKFENSICNGHTDSTTGWNGEMEGFSISYTNPYERVMRYDHMVHLNSYLLQIVTVKQVRTTYLNKPYTECADQYRAFSEGWTRM